MYIYIYTNVCVYMIITIHEKGILFSASSIKGRYRVLSTARNCLY